MNDVVSKITKTNGCFDQLRMYSYGKIKGPREAQT